MENREIIYEILRHGTSVKISAVDVASGLEVSTIVPADYPVSLQKAAARDKLFYVLSKEGLTVAPSGSSEPAKPKPPSGHRGILV